MIKAVLFDYGGVLSVSGHRGSIGKVVAELFGIDIGWENLDELHDKLRRGLISTEDFFAELSRKHSSNKVITQEEWYQASKDVFERAEPVYELARDLRKNDIKTGILSNVYQMTADVLRQLGNYDGFDPVILSCEVRMAKPDREIFELAIKQTGVSPSETIFVDDQKKSIPVAQDLGMHTVLAADPDQIVREAKDIIKKENNVEL